MTVETVRAFRNDFKEAVKQLEEKYHIVIDLGRITYDESSFRGQLTAKDGGSKDEVLANDFNKHCRMFGLGPEDLNRRFNYKGEMYEIIGIKPSKRKYPILCRKIADDSTILFTTDVKKFF